MANILDEYRQARPDLASVSDQDLIGMIHAASGVGGSPRDYAKDYLGITNKAGFGTDTAIDVGKGLVGVGQIATGAANLVSGGAAGRAMRNTFGGDLEDVKTGMSKHYSDARQDSDSAVQAADGFWNSLGALATHPRSLIGQGVETLPSMAIPMGIAGKVAKGAMGAVEGAAGTAARAASTKAAAETAEVVGNRAASGTWAGMSGTQTADKINHEQPDNVAGMYQGAAGAAATVGGITHGFSFIPGGHMADQAATTGKRMGLSVTNQAAMMGTMGAAQTGSENLATDKPFTQGMAQAIAGGIVSGGALGFLGGKKRGENPLVEQTSLDAARTSLADSDFESGWKQWVADIEAKSAAAKANVAPTIDAATGVSRPPVENNQASMEAALNDPTSLYGQNEIGHERPLTHGDIEQANVDPRAQGAPSQVDPAAAQLAATQKQAKGSKEEVAPVTDEERAAILSKYGEAQKNFTGKMDQHGEPAFVGHHFDDSNVPDKNGNVRPFTSPDKLSKAIEKLAVNDREKSEGQRASEQNLSDVFNAELGRRPTSKEVAKIASAVDLEHVTSKEQLVGHIDVALAAMEGTKKPDTVVQDALTAWRKSLDPTSESIAKVAPKEVKTEGTPAQPKEPVAVPAPPAAVLKPAPIAEVPKPAVQRAPAPVAEPAPHALKVLTDLADKMQRGGKDAVAFTDSNGKTVVKSRSAFLNGIAALEGKEKDRFHMLMGLDAEGNQTSNPMTHAEIAAAETAKTGKAVGATAISNWAKKLGLSQDHVDKAAALHMEEASPMHTAEFLDEEGGHNVVDNVGDIHKGGLGTQDMTAAELRAQQVANDFLAKNASKEVPRETTAADKQHAVLIEKNRRIAAESTKAMTLILADKSPNKAQAERTYNAMREKGDPRFSELSENNRAEWIRAYDINESEKLHGRPDMLDVYFKDLTKEHRNELSESIKPDSTARTAGPEADARPPEARSEGKEPLQSTDAAPAGAHEAAPKPAVTVRKRRVAAEKPADVKFGKDEGAAEKPYTKGELKSELHDFMGTDSLGRNVIIVDHAHELADLRDVTIGEANKGAFGWTRDGKAVLIASRIEKGQGRAAFMHEVGSHLGIDRLLDGGTHDMLASQIFDWAGGKTADMLPFNSQKNPHSLERQIAQAAVRRMESAGTKEIQTHSEVIAYFIEEAIKRGIDPTAMSYKTPVGRWFRTMWASFKAAIRKLGMNPEKLKAQDIVDMAYGAARLEVTGTWHGAAAEFRKFDHKYMGSGEGAQAYGWGTYSAERRGIARNYMEADVQRKGKGLSFDGEPIQQRIDRTEYAAAEHRLDNGGMDKPEHIGELRALKRILREHDGRKPDFNEHLDHWNDPNSLDNRHAYDWLRKNMHLVGESGSDGLLHRTDFNIKPDEWLHYDKPLELQSDKVKAAFEEPALANFLEDYGLTDAPMGDVVNTMAEEMKSDGITVRGKEFGGMGKQGDKAFAEMMDFLGVKGLKHFDSNSRADGGKIASLEQQVKVHESGIRFIEEQMASDNDGQFSTKDLQDALKDLQGAKKKLAAAKEVEGGLTNNRVVFNDKNIQRVASLRAANKDRVSFGMNAPAEPVRRAEREETIKRLPPVLQKPVRGVMATIHDVATKGAQASAFMHDLADWGTKHGLPAMKKIADTMAIKGAYKVELDQKLGDVVKGFQDLKADQQDAAQKFIKDSTFNQKWGYQPAWKKDVTVDAAAKKQYDALSPEAQKVVDQVFKHNADVRIEKQKALADVIQSHYTEMVSRADGEEAAALWQKMDSELKNAAKGDMDGPYAPLKRFGDQVVTVKSKALLDAKATNGSEYRNMLDDPAHYRVEHHESIYAAANRAKELQEEHGDTHVVERSAKEKHEYLGAGYETLSKLADAMKSRFDGADYSDADKAVAHATYRAINEAIIQSLGEHNARTSTLQRKYIAGVDHTQMMRGFAAQGYADNAFMAAMRHNKELNDQMGELRTQKDNGTGDRTMKQSFYNELQARRAANLNADTPRWVGQAMRFTTVWKLITSPAYYLQYLSQPLTMFLPLINGDHGYATGVKALMAGLRDTAAISKGLFDTDLTAVKDAGERKMLQELRASGTISIGHEQQFGHVQMMPEHGISKAWAKATDHITKLPHSVEMHNRIGSALAAYRLELAKTGDAAKATEYAKKTINTAYGDYSSFNAPRIMQGGGATKLIMQYRQFQLIHTAMLVRLMNNAFAGESPEVRRAGKLQLTYMAGHYGVLAGALGIPAAHVVAGAIKGVFGDDNDVDIDTFVKRHTGNKFMADMIMGGVPRAVFGQDLSNRMGAGDILSPFKNVDMATAVGSKKDYKDFTLGALGPFVGGLVPQMIDGVDKIQHGDMYRGLEQLMPKGVGDAMKAYRFADEGVIDAKGQTNVKKDDVTAGDIMSQALGSRPTHITEPAHDAAMVGKIMAGFKDQANTLKSQFVRARKGDGDTNELVTKWREMMVKEKAAGLKPQPLSELYKAPSAMHKRDGQMIDGVPFRKTNKGLVQDITGANHE